MVSAFRRTLCVCWISFCLIHLMIHKHPEPLRNFDYVGMYYYSLTWCCDYRKTLFTHADRVDLVRSQLLRACGEAECELVAYTFMPDHVHQLIRGCSNTSDGRRYIRLAKQYSGFYFKKARMASGRSKGTAMIDS